MTEPTSPANPEEPMTKYDDLIKRLLEYPISTAWKAADAIKELVAENESLKSAVKIGESYLVINKERIEKVEAERDELRGRIQTYVDANELYIDQRDQAQALAAAIERDMRERCAVEVGSWAGPSDDRMKTIRSTPLTTDQSALDRIVDERTKELREALDHATVELEEVKEYAEAPLYNPLEVGFRHNPLTVKEENQRYKEACEILAVGINAALSRTNGDAEKGKDDG